VALNYNKISERILNSIGLAFHDLYFDL
jgi:hypothetical protein